MARPMNGIPADLARMLDAREARWAYRRELCRQCEALIAVTLCVPQPYRTSERGKRILRAQCETIRASLSAGGISLLREASLDGADGLAVFFLCGTDARTVKLHCIALEQSLPAGRMLDIDVMDAQGASIGRTELALPPRKCFLCGRPAAQCVASARHDPEEVAALTERMFSGDMAAE